MKTNMSDNGKKEDKEEKKKTGIMERKKKEDGIKKQNIQKT